MTKAIVAYIDVLGGKDLIKKDAEGFLRKCNDIFVMLNDRLSKNYKDAGYNSITVRTFSDNLCAILPISSCQDLYAAVWQLTNYVGGVQLYALLWYNYLLRGAIGYGEIYYNSQQLSGDVLSQCVSAEEKLAIFPRVIILDSVMEKLTVQELKGLLTDNHTIAQDNDLFYFVDYLGASFLSLIVSESGNPNPHFPICWSIMGNEIAEGLQKAQGDISHRQKWLWLASYYSRLSEASHNEWAKIDWDPIRFQAQPSLKIKEYFDTLGGANPLKPPYTNNENIQEDVDNTSSASLDGAKQ